MVAALGVMVVLVAVKVILVKVSPVARLPLEIVTWPVPVVMLSPYVFV